MLQAFCISIFQTGKSNTTNHLHIPRSFSTKCSTPTLRIRFCTAGKSLNCKFHFRYTRKIMWNIFYELELASCSNTMTFFMTFIRVYFNKMLFVYLTGMEKSAICDTISQGFNCSSDMFHYYFWIDNQLFIIFFCFWMQTVISNRFS